MQKNYLPDEAILRVVSSVKGNLFTPQEWSSFSANTPGDFEARLRSVFVVDQAAETANFANGDFGLLRVNREGVFRDGDSLAAKVTAAYFLSTKVNIASITNLHEADIFVPVDILLVRPWMTYYASSVVVMKGGRETGETVIGDQDFQMSANTQTRELEASYMYRAKAIVTNSRNVMVAPHVFIQKYVSGNNVNWINESDLLEIERHSGLLDSKNSLAALLLPYNSKVHTRSWIDYRGSNPGAEEEVFHESKEFYSNLFRTEDADLYDPHEVFIDYDKQSYPVNSICWRGHINYGRDFKQRKCCNGHLGDITYDGIQNSRKEGVYAPIRSLNFNVKSK